MSQISIKIKSTGQVLSAEKGKLELSVGDLILVETPQCKELALVVDKEEEAESGAEKGEILESEVEIIRKLSEKDLELSRKLKREAQGMIPECQKKIEFHSLPMELLDAELSFDEKKLTFYFSADGRVDFRSLVSDLASTFKKLIRLQQVGARDEARFCGGHGRCGQQFCCRRFLRGDLDSITLEMAQLQNLASMGTNRITGACGKLMCCLSFENDDYKKIAKSLPKIGEKVKTEKGTGVVISTNIIKRKVLVELSDGEKVEV